MGIKTIGMYSTFGEYIRNLRLSKNVGFIKLTSNVSELDTVRWNNIERDIIPPSCAELLAVSKYLYPEMRLQALSSLIEGWQYLVYKTDYVGNNYNKEKSDSINTHSCKYHYHRTRAVSSLKDNQSQDNPTKTEATKEFEVDMCPVTGSVTMFNQQSDDNKHEDVEKSAPNECSIPTERFVISWLDGSSASKLSSFMSSIDEQITTGDIIDCNVTAERSCHNLQWKIKVELYLPTTRYKAATDILVDALVCLGKGAQVHPCKHEPIKVGEVAGGKSYSDNAPPNSSLWWSGEQY